jgi:hypothetical protein
MDVCVPGKSGCEVLLSTAPTPSPSTCPPTSWCGAAMTSRRVHSFYVPGFRIKRDVLPGALHRDWFRPPNRALRSCSPVLRHLAHSQMWGEVVVMPPPEFDLAGRAEGGPGRGSCRGDDQRQLPRQHRQYGKRVAMAQGCVSATRSTAGAHRADLAGHTTGVGHGNGQV